MTNEHYTLADALTLAGVYKQEYNLKILEIKPIVEVQTKDGAKNVQDMYVTDGTAVIKYTSWNPSTTPQYQANGGMQATGVYIKPNDKGYYSLRIAGMEKGGSLKFTPTSEIVFDYDEYKADFKMSAPKAGFTEEDKNDMTNLLNYCLSNPTWDADHVALLTKMRAKGYLRDE